KCVRGRGNVLAEAGSRKLLGAAESVKSRSAGRATSGSVSCPAMRFALITSLCALLCVVACGEREQRAAPRVAKPPSASLRLAALTDLSGFLEPCGCQSKPLGGIDKAATKLASLRGERVPVLFVAAGDLLFGPKPEGAGSNDDAATQETWKAETLVEIM